MHPTLFRPTFFCLSTLLVILPVRILVIPPSKIILLISLFTCLHHDSSLVRTPRNLIGGALITVDTPMSNGHYLQDGQALDAIRGFHVSVFL